MEYLVVVIEAIICVASYVIADYMVTHRTGLAKRLIIGQDSSSVISEMRGLASKIFYGMKEDNVKLKNYEISVMVKNEKITNVTVETEKTIVTFNEEEGDTIIHKGFTEKRAIINDTFLLICIMSIIFFLCISIRLL